MPTILAIDDKQDNLIALSALLKLTLPGCVVHTALSGQEGLNKAQATIPDAILLDIVMPVMDGYEVCRRLRANGQTKHIPIVMVTAIRTDAQSRIKGLEAGADAFLAKPIDEGELTAQINVMLRIRDAEHLLLQERNLLKERVQSRTIELEQANRKLHTELAHRKLAEEILRKSEEKYRRFYEDAPLGYQSLDASGNFLEVNKEWLRVLGYSKEDVIGRFFADFVAPESLENFTINFPRFKAHGSMRGNEFDMIQKNGSRVTVSYDGNIEYDEEERFRRTHCIMHDITARKQAEHELREYQDRLKALASRLTLAEEKQNQLLAEALHDGVGQSLAFTKLKIQMLGEKAESGQMGEELGQLCQVVSDMIEDVRTLTLGLNSPMLKSLGFERAVANWLQEQVQGRHSIRTEFADDGSYKDLSEDEQAILFRSIRELVTNVVKHAHATLIQVAIHRIKDEVVVTVTDNGCGFNADEVMVDRQEKGFGLFSIQERLDQMRGTLILDSTPGQGCRVLMKLSVADTSCCKP